MQGKVVDSKAGGLSMKWHECLVNVVLWACVAVFVIYGIMVLTGAQYAMTGQSAAQVYDETPSMRYINYLFGILLIVLAGMAFLTRGKLAAYSAEGPERLYSLIHMVFLAATAYAIFSHVARRADLPTVLLHAVPFALMGFVANCLNGIYYDKRAKLFS